jgi:glucose-6-phosphate isomerase, archaeal
LNSRPFSFQVLAEESRLARCDNHLERKLSALTGQYADRLAFDRLLHAGDRVVYEVYEMLRPEVAGDLRSGLSVVHPGRVGNEFFMTKGHFHSIVDTAEVYYCLKGRGLMLMENAAGEWAVEEMAPGCAVHVAPGWAHRSVNIGDDEDLVTFFVYPADAGHDYGTIERRGFRKLVLKADGGYRIADNPAWPEPPSNR